MWIITYLNFSSSSFLLLPSPPQYYSGHYYRNGRWFQWIKWALDLHPAYLTNIPPPQSPISLLLDAVATPSTSTITDITLTFSTAPLVTKLSPLDLKALCLGPSIGDTLPIIAILVVVMVILCVYVCWGRTCSSEGAIKRLETMVVCGTDVLMEGWGDGGMRWWRYEVMEVWGDGGMRWWRDGVMEGLGDGRMGWWRKEVMEGWVMEGWGMRWWRDGVIEGWGDGEMKDEVME